MKSRKKLCFMKVQLAVHIEAAEIHLTQWYLAFTLVAGRP